MSNSALAELALRRQALVTQCRMQRLMVAAELRELGQPLQSGSGLLQSLGGKGPLALAAIVAGLIASRSRRTVPLLKLGASVWALVRTGLTLLRSEK